MALLEPSRDILVERLASYVFRSYLVLGSLCFLKTYYSSQKCVSVPRPPGGLARYSYSNGTRYLVPYTRYGLTGTC